MINDLNLFQFYLNIIYYNGNYKIRNLINIVWVYVTDLQTQPRLPRFRASIVPSFPIVWEISESSSHIQSGITQEIGMANAKIETIAVLNILLKRRQYE